MRPAVGLNLLGSPVPLVRLVGFAGAAASTFKLQSYTNRITVSHNNTIHLSLTHMNYNYNLPGIKAGNVRVRGT